MGNVKVSVVKASGIKANKEFMSGKFARHDEDIAAIKAITNPINWTEE